LRIPLAALCAADRGGFKVRIPAGFVSRLATCALLLVGAALVACGGDADETDSAPKRLVVALEYTGLESNDQRDLQGTEGWQLRPQFETLIDVDRKTGEFVPMLATEWQVAPDGKSVRFKLRQGVQFQNGFGEMTADDIKFNYEHLAYRDTSPAETARRRVQRIEVVDKYEVIAHLRSADPSHIEDQFTALYHQGFIKSKKDFEARGDPKGLNEMPLAGTGPYQMTSRQPGSSIVFKRVDSHWRVTPDFEELEYRIINEASTRLSALLAREIHITTVPVDVQKVAEDRGMTRITGKVPSLRFFIDPHDCCTLNPNTKQPNHPNSPLMDVRVRKALNKAIDRNAINKAFLEGRGEIMVQAHHHPTRPGWDPSWQQRWEKEYGYDPAAATALLREAGYTAQRPLKTTMFAPVVSNVPGAEDIVETVIDYWRKVGVQVDFVTMDRAAFRPRAENHEFDNIWWMYSTASPLLIGWNTYSYTGLPGTTGNFKSANTLEMDRLYEQMLAETNPARFDALSKQLGELNFNHHSNVPLFWIPAEVMADPKVVAEWTWPGNVGGFYSHLEYVKARK
jgi:peptide/nickel transport system substrate-binding protein